ncbi:MULTISPECIES: CoB--CoM heterodisulfide reductase subunit C [Methanobrevibacter]|uniref:CoB--CoM heterodisulfide reductase subunit C n=1 Tax=Methanobrevibacter TaxID=2172 RepID=UPI00257DE79F|nr:CoB--CoM heterodisulfide reductase subunit C [Methanobrevibacter sp.]MBR2666304.1 CoB--CoM heterodisulfide reductase subunit C [Methanobrevibacter sp.]MBR3197187.1 CoB--CoM heterodisulfide reductase subunit C [Methanobrevibacter sp.]
MSIINRLKSMFTGDNEESDVNDDVINTSDDVQVTSSKTETETVVAEEETVAVAEEAAVEESEDSVEDLASEDIDPIEEKVEALKEEIHEKVEAKKEEIHEKAEAVKEEIQEKVEAKKDAIEAKEDSNNNDKERDKMTLLTDKELLTDANRDPDFTAEFIDAGIETVQHCFQCGTCSGSCPSGRRTPYKVRQIVRKCLLGLKEEVITDDALWMCTTCYTCQERCLRSVKIVEIIKKARNIAAHAGYMAKPHKMTGVFVMNTGHGVPINDATKALRTKIGLPEIPPTTHAYPEALAEVQKICKITGFDELIGYDEETGGLKE